jgi:ankyrin repeat protein
MFTIAVSGPVVVTDNATDKPITDPVRLRTFHGLSSGRETCAKYHDGPVADLDLKGGAVTLAFDEKSKKLRIVSVFTGTRKLTPAELKALVADTDGQWNDGIGEGCFDRVAEKKKVTIDLTPFGRKPTTTQVDDGTPPPRVSAGKAAGAALAKAAGDGDLAAVQRLVAAGANITARDRYGRPALTAAIAGDHTDVALFLLERGADPNAADKVKWPPLSWAGLRSGWVKHQNVKLAEALLAAGADVNGRNKDGYTVLHWASNRGSARLVELLVGRGADVNAKTTEKYNAGRTPLMLATGVEVVRMLLAAGADVTVADENGETAATLLNGAARKLVVEKTGGK